MRLCECGCGRELQQRPKETDWHFKRRRFASNVCSRLHPTAKLEPVCCKVCGKVLERRRFKNGRLESVSHYKKRMYCSREHRADGLRGKPRSTKPTAKPPTASHKPRKTATKPKATPKPKPTPVKPQTVSQRVFTGLPDPRRNQWATVAPAQLGEGACPLHPSERAASCTSCKIASTPHRTVARVGDSTPAWRRNA